jgi:Uma2 family endonuclease
MATLPRPYLTPEQYLEMDRSAERGSEYYNGETFPMEAVSLTHDRICDNISAGLRTQLQDGPCTKVGSNVRLRCGPAGPYFYPDIFVFCGAPVLEDGVEDTLLDATVIFEILSPSTERYDRTFKFEHYQKLAGLRHYLLVAQDKVSVEHRQRHQDHSWTSVVSSDPRGVVGLTALNCLLPVATLFEKVSPIAGR